VRSSSVDQRTREKAAIKAREAAIFMNMAMERNAESGFCSRSMSGETSYTPSEMELDEERYRYVSTIQ
jgi:hypothetical protein